MSQKMNKVITNSSVVFTDDEVAALASSFAPIVSACISGIPSGYTYTGDGTYVDINYNQSSPIIYLKSAVTDTLTIVDTHETLLSNNSANWDNVYSVIDENAQNWDNAYSTVTAYSATGKWLVADDITGKQNLLSEAETAAIHDVSAKLAISALSFNGDDGSITAVTLNGTKSAIAQPDVSNFLTKTLTDTYYCALPAGLLDETEYVYTTSGWRVLQGGGGSTGGMSQVSHDDSLSGDGNTSNLGMASSAALNMSALSAASAVYAASTVYSTTDGTSSYSIGSWMYATDQFLNAGPVIRSGDGLYADYAGSAKWVDGEETIVSSFADIIEELHYKADEYELTKYLYLSAAADTYLTKASAAELYQPKGYYIEHIFTESGISGDGKVDSPLGFDTTYKVPSAENANTAQSALSAAGLGNAVGSYSSFAAITSAIDAKLELSSVSFSGASGSEIVTGISGKALKNREFRALSGTFTGGNSYQCEDGNALNFYKIKVYTSADAATASADDAWSGASESATLHIVLE